jgi:hypothetical protein
VKLEPPFQRLVPSKSHLPSSPFGSAGLLERRVNSSPPFNPLGPVTASLCLVTHPKQRIYRRDEQTQAPPFNPRLKRREPTRHLTKTTFRTGKCSLQVPFGPPSYSRKPSPFGPNMSICAKGVSRGVHNIAFSLSPDRFRAFDLFFLHIVSRGVSTISLPDRFRVFDLFFLHIVSRGVSTISLPDRFRAFDLFLFAHSRPRVGANGAMMMLKGTTKGCRATTKSWNVWVKATRSC